MLRYEPCRTHENQRLRVHPDQPPPSRMKGVGEMDPITLIVAALAAGAAAGLGDTASQAIKDAYAGLKGLIKRRFAGMRRQGDVG